MHGNSQPDGGSPKQVNCPASTSQVKPASDSGFSSHSQVNGKKRERRDHDQEPVKRGRSLRSDDVDVLQNKSETDLKSEVMRITEKGRLTEVKGVEKFVELMHTDGRDEKLDLGSRTMLAGVIAATDNFECIKWFLHCRGLTVLDEWLQDFHRGEIVDGNGLQESDKSVVEFLLVLLQALDKVPVNLLALRMCSIGRSVNRLRSHKIVEIQKRARSLVDKWKRGVEAELTTLGFLVDF